MFICWLYTTIFLYDLLLYTQYFAVTRSLVGINHPRVYIIHIHFSVMNYKWATWKLPRGLLLALTRKIEFNLGFRHSKQNLIDAENENKGLVISRRDAFTVIAHEERGDILRLAM